MCVDCSDSECLARSYYEGSAVTEFDHLMVIVGAGIGKGRPYRRGYSE